MSDPTTVDGELRTLEDPSLALTSDPKKTARRLVMASTLDADEKDDLVLFVNKDLDLANSIAERENTADLTDRFLRKALHFQQQSMARNCLIVLHLVHSFFMHFARRYCPDPTTCSRYTVLSAEQSCLRFSH